MLTKEESGLIKKIEKAANIAMHAEIDLLKNGRVERSFSSYFANQISKQINSEIIHSDPFYNKHLGAAKILEGRVIELDIAVHERNVDRNNLVAIEIETNNDPTHDDIWKIEGLTQRLNGYGYRLGLYIVFGVSKEAGKIIEMQWYKDGKPL